MITTRIKLNLVVFGIIAVITIAWSAVNLFEFDRIDRPYTVTARFESSPGLAPGFEATYLGHSIGSISGVRLRDGFSEVDLRIDRDTEIPAAVGAAARRKSAIGEPFVDLFPMPGTNPASGPRLADGDQVALENTSSPISYADLFTAIDSLVAAVDADQLKTIVTETAAALDGRGDDLRAIIVSTRELTGRTAANADVIDTLIDDLSSITGTLADNDESFNQVVTNLGDLTDTLIDSEASLNRFLDETPSALELLARIVERNDGSLLCALDGLASLEDVADAPTLAALSSSLEDSAELGRLLDEVVASGFLKLNVLLSPLENAPRYPTPRPAPTAPVVPDCGDFATPDPSQVALAGDAPLGPGGTYEPVPDDEIAVAPRHAVPTEVVPIGRSDLAAPGESAFAKAIRAGIPIVIAAALAGLLFLLGRRIYEARTATAVGTGPADLDDDS